MTSRNRFAVERLESRWCPALTASLGSSGTLTISGTADNDTIRIVQDSETAATFQVLDGDAEVGDGPFTDVSRIRLSLTDADDQVTIDLGGQTLSGSVTANLGDAANTLSVVNGEIGGRLAVSAGDDDDVVTLGDGTNELTVRDVDVRLYGGIDMLTAKSGVNVTRSLLSAYVNEWTLEEGATADNVFVRGGSGGNTIEVAGDVTGNLVIDAFFWSGSDDGTTVNVSGAVDGSLLFFGSDLEDALTVSGDVGGSLAAYTFSGDDTVSISGAVGGRLGVDTGADDDQITLGNVVGGRASVSAGAGDDQLTIASTAQLLGTAVVNMGAGADSVTLDDAADVETVLINGGSGTDTFAGSTTRDGVRRVSF